MEEMLENHFEMIIYSEKGHEWMPKPVNEKLMEENPSHTM